MKILLAACAAITLFSGEVLGQFGQKEEALDILSQTSPGDPVERPEDLAELAEEFSRQRVREIEDAINETFRMAGSSGRSSDPFGFPMGAPLKEEAVAVTDEQLDQQESERAAAEMAAGFGTAVRGIDIRGINPGKNEFLVGADNVYEGDVVDISGTGGVFRIWVVEVEDDGVTVMDDRSKKTEKIPLSLGVSSIPSSGWGAAGRVEEAPPY